MRLALGVRAAIVVLVSLLIAIPNVSAFVRRAPPGWQPGGRYGALASRPQYVVLLVLDGGLPSYFKLANFPHLAALARNGVAYTRAWDGMLETETPTGHASLGTGSLPRRHGILSFSWVTDRDVVEHPTNPIPIQQGQLEQILRRSGVPSMASLLKAHDRTATVVVTSGHKDYAVDSVGGWAADYLMFYAEHGQTWTPVAIPRHVPPQSVLQAPGLTAYAPHLGPGDQDSLAVHLAMSAFDQLRQRMTIVNLPEFDWPLGHLDGGQANTWLAWKLMQRLDDDLGYIEWDLYRQHLLKQTLFVITADHGMVTLNHSIPHEVIETAVKSAGATLASYEYHSAGYLWLKERDRAQQVATKISTLGNPFIRAVYYRKPGTYTYSRVTTAGEPVSPQLDAAYQFLLGTMAGQSAPQVSIFLKENSDILGRNQTNWKGDHGGPSWNAQHIPLVLAGPGVRSGVRSRYPATIYDVAPTILSLLGVAPEGMDGVTLSDAMLDPPQSAVDAQTTRGAELAPVQVTLRAQSRLDGP